MRLFLDANVLFSAAWREAGSVRIFFRLAVGGVCDLVASPYAIDEATRNLARKLPGRVPDLQQLLTTVELCPEAPSTLVIWAASQGLPAKDAPILAAAVAARTEILVTGDRTDFGHLFGRQLRGTAVLPPAEALERVVAAAESKS
jgi:predicted nucleic acid-binding protein